MLVLVIFLHVLGMQQVQLVKMLHVVMQQLKQMKLDVKLIILHVIILNQVEMIHVQIHFQNVVMLIALIVQL